MPARTKKQTASRFVELNLNLKVPKKTYPLVTEALAAVLDLAGLKANSEAVEKVKGGKKEAKPKAGRKTKVKPVKAKTAQLKQAKPTKTKSVKAKSAARKNPPNPETAALIRELRTKAGLSQKDLAEKMGAKQNLVSLLETGRQKVDLVRARKLGQIFKTPYQDLMK